MTDDPGVKPDKLTLYHQQLEPHVPDAVGWPWADAPRVRVITFGATGVPDFQALHAPHPTALQARTRTS